MRIFVILLALATGSCATAPPLPVAAGAEFDPLAFFSARASGAGTIHKLFSGPVPLRVRSVGSQRTADRLVVTQTISEGSKPPRKRIWTIRRVAPNRFEGTLTPDAVGPVTMVVRGPRAWISYTMKSGLKVDQQLALQARDGTLCNRLEVRKFGLRVAWVGEKIERTGWMPLILDDAPQPPPVTCPGA